ncbi:Ktr system potassium uptake protein B [Maioricimonas rarisocia]|uniref:Ktr system potassium uptake protein B n=1 Tax=Maioricimonas rarisocia TaxID=2528026 RepID=A0A517ZCL7_9PLAN|nr:potassium transporter TrkG [Maioricimonas rarisocia]QDU40205.1 Ktr system potassium uptake protein B [Maioricimonas rarisocia]
MDQELEQTRRILAQRSRYPHRTQALRWVDGAAQVVGVVSVAVGHGLRNVEAYPWAFELIAVLAMASVSGGILARYRWSLRRPSFFSRHRPEVVAAALWSAGVLLAVIFGPLLPFDESVNNSRWLAITRLSEFLIVAYALAGAIRGIRRIAARGTNPALLLVGSFVVLVALGTAALMLPRARQDTADDPDPGGAPFLVALFTSTSASCVTGLTVVDTRTYWSGFGQTVILVLFQIGGLGIMTFGGFFAVAAGRSIQLREYATLRDLLASEPMGDLRRLVLAILGFTLSCELIGAVLLWGLWPEHPWPQRLFLSLFHSVSAFCNAGFALTENSFVGMADRWQVWGALSGLIILGGFGFPSLHQLVTTIPLQRLFIPFLYFREPVHQSRRASLTSRLVLVTTIVLLAGGTLGIYMLEHSVPQSDSELISLADAWFQSVTFRTAGFNTVDLGELQPTSKLLAIALMFIGASPGSTGGGVKTVVFAITVLSVISIVRDRPNLECMHRTIPTSVANRALGILFLALATLMTVTMLLVFFEQRPGLFMDHLFEAASAVGTVGVSTTVTLPDQTVTSTTQSLSSASRVVIIVAMFLGRVGPLTFLLGMAGSPSPAEYSYPAERVTLG